MAGTTAYDGACACGGLIESAHGCRVSSTIRGELAAKADLQTGQQEVLEERWERETIAAWVAESA